MLGIILILEGILTFVTISICFNVFNAYAHMKGNIIKLLAFSNIVCSITMLALSFIMDKPYIKLLSIIFTAIWLILGIILMKGKSLPDKLLNTEKFVIESDEIQILSHTAFNRSKKSKKVCVELLTGKNLINITKFDIPKNTKRVIIYAMRTGKKNNHAIWTCKSLYAVENKKPIDWLRIALLLIGYIELIAIYAWIAFMPSNFNIAEYWFGQQIDVIVCLYISIVTVFIAGLSMLFHNKRAKIATYMFILFAAFMQLSLLYVGITGLFI